MVTHQLYALADGLDTSLRGAADVLARYDAYPDGRLDVREFAQLVRDIEDGVDVRDDGSAEYAPNYTGGHAGGFPYDGMSAPNREVHHGRWHHGDGPHVPPMHMPHRVLDTFEHFDRNRSGFIDYIELRNALQYYGLSTTLAGAARVLAAYDDRPDGRLDVNEFARLVRDLEDGHARYASGYVASDPELYPAYVPARVRAAFAAHDADRNGHLDHSELRAALEAYGIPKLTLHEAKAILSAYDDNPDGTRGRSTDSIVD